MKEYILGEGIFAIGGVDIALTRGGGQFVVERTYKEIVADGDMGLVEGRLRKDGSRPKLTIRALEILSDNLTKMYPAVEVDTTTTPGTATMKPVADIQAADYVPVTWTGKDSENRSIVITLTKAINTNNIDWALIDKDEIVPELMYEGAYDKDARKDEPWKVDFVDAV